VEGAGVPIGLSIDGANVHDKWLVEPTLASIPIERPYPTLSNPQHLCLDKGYDYTDTRELVVLWHYIAHIKARGEEVMLKRTKRFKARRWVVERTHSWFNRFRRILIRWEKKPQNYLAMLHLACAYLAYRAAGVLG
jgi:transposase